MEFQEFRGLLMSRALEIGFVDCEVYLEQSRHFEVVILDGEVSQLENSARRILCFRGTWNGQMGYAFSEDLDESIVDCLIHEASENAGILEDNNPEKLYKGSAVPILGGYEPLLDEISMADKIVAAKQMEAGALDYDAMAAIDYCVLGFHDKAIDIKNTLGLHGVFHKNFISAEVCALAQQNGDTKTGSEYFLSNSWTDFHPEEIGRTATKKAISHLGAYTVRSGEYHILLENQVAANLLGIFCSVFYGENVDKGFSLLGNKLHEKIASPKVTLRDDALLAGRIASVPFDSEGVPCQNKGVIENGRLEMYLHNLKTAKAANVPPTGNGFKPSPQAPVKTACTNFYIASGQKTPRTLMAQLGDGLLITEISGLHAGANPVSGDFSLSAEGFVVERGQKVRPVEQITIAGNFYTLLKNIEEVGNDLRFLPPQSFGAMGAPMLMVKKLAVSGN